MVLMFGFSDFRFPEAHTGRLFQGANGDFNYYFEMVNSGLPASFTGCTFDPSLAVGNAVSRPSDVLPARLPAPVHALGHEFRGAISLS
jgi:hypothetical protein